MSEFEPLIETFNKIIADVKSGKIKLREGFQCRDCFGRGWREVPDPQGSNYRGVIKCRNCEYWNFRRQDYENRA